MNSHRTRPGRSRAAAGASRNRHAPKRLKSMSGGSLSYSHGSATDAPPLPLGQAIVALPSQYLTVFTRPSVSTFFAEKEKARWEIVWVELLSVVVITAAISLIGYSLTFPLAHAAILPIIRTLLVESVCWPLTFFLYAGIQYRVARSFSATKEGTFLTQCYTTLLFVAPLSIPASAAAFIPGIGRLMIAAAGIYGAVLTTLAIGAVHRISGGKAVLAFLAPFGVIVALAVCIFVGLLLSAHLRQAP